MLPPLSRRHHIRMSKTSLGLPGNKPAPLFLLLFTGNHQRRTVSQPQESSIVGGATSKKQREDSDTGFSGERGKKIRMWAGHLAETVENLG